MKKLLNQARSPYPSFKYDLKMKLSTLFILATLFSLKANDSYGQRTKVTLNMINVTVGQVLDKIENSTEFEFVYIVDDVDLERKVSVSAKKEKIVTILGYIFNKTETTFNLNNRRIYLVKRVALKATSSLKQTRTKSIQQTSIDGIVTDKNGEPLPGVSVVEKGTNNGTTTDFDGKYSFEVSDSDAILIFSYIGMQTREVGVNDNTKLDISLKEDLLMLDQVVVTGAINPRSKLESSVAITSIGTKMISEEAPQSAANLLKLVPGFMVESSGGAVGNNLFARGIPSGGAYQYVQIQEDGLPLFEDGALQFGNVDNWLRIDETVQRMEAVKGGSGSIYATNAPGGIVNIISKTGSNEFKGVAKFTTGDFGLLRTDVNIGGALIQDKLFFNIGGFYRVDQGVRSPGFTANKGGQFKANLKYQFDNGYVKFNYKKLNDRNIFYLPIPLKGDDSGDPQGVDGFDPNYGTLTSRNFSKLKVPQPGGGSYERDLEDGIHPIVDAIGAEMKFNIGENLSIKNAFKHTAIDLTYNAIFTGASPTTPDDFADGMDIANPIYEYAETGLAASPSLVAEVGFWAIDKKMNNFANNFQFGYSKNKFDVTFGHYYSNFSTNQVWNWSNLLIEATDDPKLLNLHDGDLSAGDTNYSRTWNGITKISRLNRESQLKGVINALFVNAVIDASDALTIDIGLRYDIDRYTGFKAFEDKENLVSLGFDDTTADDFILNTGAPYTYWEYDVDKLSYSFGANYKFNEKTAAYIRVSSGFRSPTESSYFKNATNLSIIKPTEVKQYELGYKLKSENVAVFANLFYMDMSNLAYNGLLADGTTQNLFAGAENLGLEIETIFNYKALNLSFKGTIQDPKLTDYSAGSGELNGNSVRRIPKMYFNFRPSFDITKRLNVFSNWGYFGEKFVNNENTIELPAYSEVDFGGIYKVNNVTFSANLKNAFNTIGLTEGNPRVTDLTLGDTYYARPILGRHVTFSVAYSF